MASPLSALQMPPHLPQPAHIAPESPPVLRLPKKAQQRLPRHLRRWNTGVGFQTPRIIMPRPLPRWPERSGPKTPEMPHVLDLVQAETPALRRLKTYNSKKPRR